jgi:hypothetical protein
VAKRYKPVYLSRVIRISELLEVCEGFVREGYSDGRCGTWHHIIMVKEGFTSYTESIGSSAESVEMVT